MFSAIEEEDNSTVIESCYWPLLKLAEEKQIPMGIELSGITLERINQLDPRWVEKFRSLCEAGVCELIGSGYSQLIGPLVPAEVNQMNLDLGARVYIELLGIQPDIYLINEMAYSQGIILHYLNQGAKAIIMEWENPFSFHLDWDKEWAYYPQEAVTSDGRSVPIIWSRSIAFQKFQRYAHGEKTLEEYLNYLSSHTADVPRAFPLYSNDVEIFDFRPGRFEAEAKLDNKNDWERIEELIDALKKKSTVQFCLPKETLDKEKIFPKRQKLVVESADQPSPVKKQPKYNLSRWAVTGKNDLFINTTCYKILNAFQQKGMLVSDEDKKELCWLWSSDFRTHITAKRWKKYLVRLKNMEQRWQNGSNKIKGVSINCPDLDNNGDLWRVRGKNIRVSFDIRKGMSIYQMSFPEIFQSELIGTLPHGYYDDIRLGGDFYSGHLTFQTPAKGQVTDLNLCEPTIESNNGILVLSAVIDSPFGTILKRWKINDDLGTLTLSYVLDWKDVPRGSLRMAYLTLKPGAFNQENLAFSTNNGGALEKFLINKKNFSHGSPASFLVSANQAVGITEGTLEIGDQDKKICVFSSRETASVIGMITNQMIRDQQFTRVCFSGEEMDETVRGNRELQRDFQFVFSGA